LIPSHPEPAIPPIRRGVALRQQSAEKPLTLF
jgi:hypothetical protein